MSILTVCASSVTRSLGSRGSPGCSSMRSVVHLFVGLPPVRSGLEVRPSVRRRQLACGGDASEPNYSNAKVLTVCEATSHGHCRQPVPHWSKMRNTVGIAVLGGLRLAAKTKTV